MQREERRLETKKKSCQMATENPKTKREREQNVDQ